MPVLLRKQGVSLSAVGLSTLLLLLVTLKFVFGPWTDRLAAAGRTRVWMAGLQTAVALCFVSLALLPPSRGVAPMLIAVGIAYLLVAVLDVITDGVAVRLLSAVERRLGWTPSMLLLALLVAAGFTAARWLPEAPPPALAAAGGKAGASVLRF